MTAPPVAPLNAKGLLEDLKKLLVKIEADLLARSSSADVPEIGARLRTEYDRARASKRTAMPQSNACTRNCRAGAMGGRVASSTETAATSA